MIRLFITLIIALLVGATLAWLLDHPGQVVIEWESWLIETSLAVLAIGIALLLLLVLVLQQLWHWARRDLPFVGAQRHLRRQKRGLEAMNNSVLALSSGRVEEAERLIAKTKRLLPPQPMLHILESQAAQLSGNKGKAKLVFEEMLKDKGTAIIGIRGLLASALDEGRSSEALRLAEAAREADPKSKWAVYTHFNLLTSQLKWADALAILKSKSGQLLGVEHLARYKMIVNHCLAKEADLAGKQKEARAFATAAYGFDKGFEPLVLSLARFSLADGKPAKAKTYIETAWKTNPSKRLAEAYAQIDPNERPLERLKRFKKLIENNKTHNESKLQRAERAIAAEQFDEARPIVESIMAKNNEPRAYELKAKMVLAVGEENCELEAEKWQIKGQKIAVKAAYYCKTCHTPHDVWQHHCQHCGQFDGLVGLEAMVAGDISDVKLKTVNMPRVFPLNIE
jgi:HemY protein